MARLSQIVARLARLRWKALDPRLRMVLCAAVAGLAFGTVEFGEPVEDALRGLRTAFAVRPASGDTVIVAIDDRSIRELGPWPWPRRRHAELLQRLEALGASKALFDIDFSPATAPAEDARLASALRQARIPTVLEVRFFFDANGVRTDHFPLPAFRPHAQLATSNFRYSLSGAVWKLPYALEHGGAVYPSFAARLSRARGGPGEMFPIDYTTDVDSIPLVSATDVLHDRPAARALSHRAALVGVTSPQWGDQFYVPGHGRMAGVYLHALGAETLREGRPFQLGWLPPLALALLLGLAAFILRGGRFALATLTLGVAACLILPILLEPAGIFVDVVPSLFALLWLAIAWSRRSSRLGGAVNPVSGLPNLAALRKAKGGADAFLIVGKVRNYAEICSTLSTEGERELVLQISSRLRIGADTLTIYQGDDGVFGWLASDPGREIIEDHLDALSMLFRTPLHVGNRPIDIAITFGVDADFARSPANRLTSALVAAEEAAAENLRWKHYDPEKLKDVEWKLSLLSQLDTAIEKGHLWVAYQPKLDLVTRRIVGAEALVRWNHPDKGEIGPIDFIPAAEQNGRIERLTTFVLAEAVRAAATVGRRDRDFGISVNLSARLIDSFDLVATVERLLAQHRLAPHRLTLEVTETAALTRGASSMDALFRLRAMGVLISIDDYGTGLSTLEYLKRIPANEIKVDKGFVQSIYKSQSDKLMVHSTIQLAHSLGQKVVAEGVEDLQTLEALTYMGCDVAQGFFIGRPMPFRSFWRSVLEQRSREAA